MKLFLHFLPFTLLAACSGNTAPGEAAASRTGLVPDTSDQSPASVVASSTAPTLASPECVVRYGNQLLISNVGKELKPQEKDGDGYIVTASLDGTLMSVLSEGIILHAPKGMCVIGDVVYVTDIDRVVGIEIPSKKKVFEVDMQTTGSTFLNDIVKFRGNELLVSATDVNMILKLNLETTHFERLPVEGLHGPNGLVVYDFIYCVELGENSDGRILRFTESGKEPEVVGKFRGALDGVHAHEGQLWFSDWKTGGVYHMWISQSGEKLIGMDYQGPADFCFVDSRLCVPDMPGNRIWFIDPH